MEQETLKDLLVEQIRDIYDAEKQLVKALPKLAKAVESEDLKEALTQHLEETQGQVRRLEQIFEHLEMPARGKACKGMKGLIEEGNEAATEEEGILKDLAVIAGAQRVEHYEISAYGTARAIAEQMELTEVVDLLKETLDEEESADQKLTEIAETLYQSEEASDEEDEEEAETVGSTRSASRAPAPARGRGGRSK